MLRLSIIVPFFNAESYIERCLYSLINQNLDSDDYEIICINDGSKDQGRNKVIEIQKYVNIIRLIDQENSGVSVARNTGINAAKGNYLMMVDADDYLHENVLPERLHFAERNDLQIAYSGLIILNEKMETVSRQNHLPDKEEILTGIDFFEKHLKGRSEIQAPHSSVAILIKTEFLNFHGLRYLPGVPFLEDGEFMARVICMATRAISFSEPIYYRTTTPGSATQSRLYYSDIAKSGFIKSAKNLSEFRDQYCQNQIQKIFLNQYILHFAVLYITSHSLRDYIINYGKMKRQIHEGNLQKIELKGCSSQYKEIGTYYNHSIHCIYIFWIINKIRKYLAINKAN